MQAGLSRRPARPGAAGAGLGLATGVKGSALGFQPSSLGARCHASGASSAVRSPKHKFKTRHASEQCMLCAADASASSQRRYWPGLRGAAAMLKLGSRRRAAGGGGGSGTRLATIQIIRKENLAPR